MRRLRRRNHEWAEGWGGYEAYEENNEQGKLRCLLLRREKIFLYIFMMRLLRGGFINIKDMYNNDGGQGGARVCEAHEVK
jgi:hypothetical protein